MVGGSQRSNPEVSLRDALKALATSFEYDGRLVVTLEVEESIDSLTEVAKAMILVVVNQALDRVYVDDTARTVHVRIREVGARVDIVVVDNGSQPRDIRDVEYFIVRQQAALFEGTVMLRAGDHGGWALTMFFDPLGASIVPEASSDPFATLRPVRSASGEVTDFIFSRINEAALLYTNRSREELIGQSVREMWPALTSIGLIDWCTQTLATGVTTARDAVHFVRHTDGQARYIDLRIVKVGDALAYSWRDVTDRINLTDHYQMLAENASDVVFRLDALWVVEWVSASIERVLGWTPDELQGKMMGGIVHPDDVAAVTARISTPETATTHSESRLIDTGGVYHWFSVVSRVVFDDDGNVVERVGSFHLIDDQVRQREDLLASEQRYRLLAENSSDLVVLSNEQDEITWISPAVKTLTGWDQAAVVGKKMIDFVFEEDRHLVTDDTGRAAGQRVPVEYRIYQADGRTLWVQARGRALRDEKGTYLGRVIGMRDIEAEVVARTALHESNAQFRLLAENASDVVYQYDTNGIIVWVSPSITKLLGWQASSLIGSSHLELMDRRDQVRAAADQAKILSGARGERLELRYRSSTGVLHWMSKYAQAVRGKTGHVTGVVVGLQVIDEQVRIREALEESQASLQTLAENASDLVYRFTRDGIIDWISPSVESALGWVPQALIGRPAIELIAPADVDRVLAWRTLVFSGETRRSIEVRYLRSDGRASWMSVDVHPIFDDHANVASVVVAAKEINDVVAARRASATLAAGSAALLRAKTEDGLLNEMCEIAVRRGGYSLSWYGRKVEDSAHNVLKVASSTRNRDYVDQIEVTWGSEPSGQGPTGESLRYGKVVVLRDLQHAPAFQPWRTKAREHDFQASATLPVYINGVLDGCWSVYASDPLAFDDIELDTLENIAAEIGFGIEKLRERDQLSESLRDQLLLSTAIEHSAESILISAPDGTILYANPAATRTSGYEREELVGSNPRILQSGLQDRSFYERMWATLLHGSSWQGVLVNKRKDGALYEEDVTISPVRGDDGSLISYVAVKRDITKELLLTEHLDREVRDRDAIVEVMRDVERADSVEETAKRFCQAATKFDFIDFACLVLLQGDGGLQRLGLSAGAELNIDDPEGLATVLHAHREDVGVGPLLLTRAELERIGGSIDGAALRTGVMAPVLWERQLIGVLILGTADEAGAKMAPDRLGHFEALAGYAGTLIGSASVEFGQRHATTKRIRSIIASRAFEPVFQAFVEPRSGATVGYEALTRFSDGMRPDICFAEAHSVGLGSTLEAVCAAAALEAAAHLPEDLFISLNFSPEAIENGKAAEVCAATTRPIVLEVTEHTAIHDYDGLVRAVAAIPNVKLAVDDAGAGYTSLSHILQLRPEYVKLDISIVRNIDRDPARQAMAAGMCHFAASMGTVIIAEGIERQAEVATLMSIGKPLPNLKFLIQGYYYSRPGPLPAPSEPSES